MTGVFIGLLIVGPVFAAPVDAYQLSDGLLQSMLVLGVVTILFLIVLAVMATRRERLATRVRRRVRGRADRTD